MSEENNVNLIMQKKLEDSWGNNAKNVNNFAIAQELTVTITLNEYRELIEAKATFDAKIYEEKTAYSKKYTECEELKKQVESLKQILKGEEKENEEDE